MHIGIDCRLPTYQMGGISQYTIHLIRALGDLAADERFAIFHSRKEQRSFLPSSKGNFSRSDLWTPCHHRWERQSIHLELLGRQLLGQGLDVYHSPDFIPPAGGARWRVITVHDLNFLYFPDFLTAESRRYYVDQIEWAVSAADHIVADSEATRGDLNRLLGVSLDKVTTIHLAANPVFGVEYAPQAIARTRDECGVGEGFILSVGTLEPRKNLVTLLHVYYRLRQERGITVPLVLVGGKGWKYDEVFEDIEQLRLTAHVRHLTGVSDLQLAHLYRAAGVLAFPSHYEGFGLPALEAMQSGCPVVAANRGSLPEVVGDAAPLLEPDDADAWTDALERVLTDGACADELRRAGLARAQDFSWHKTAAETLAVYYRAG